MKRVYTALTILVIATGTRTIAAQSAAARATGSAGRNAIAARIDAFLAPQVAAHQFSGAVLITQRGKVLVNKGYGMADEARQLPDGPNTAFPIGSVTKAFTATAILQLQEAGKLRVQDHLCRFIAGCPQVWKAVTIDQLLTMTSGIRDFNFVPDEDMTSPAKLFAYLGQQPLQSSPGTTWAYDDFGYRFLGYVVQQVSGEQYDTYIRTHIFRPLGMRHSTFFADLLSLPNHARAYPAGSLSPIAQHPTGTWSPGMSFFDAPGGIVSTLNDLRRWDRALDTSQLLSKSTLHSMFSPHVKTNIPPGGPPLSSYYGYGWFIDKLFNRPVILHPGGSGPYWAYFLRLPTHHSTIVVLCNRPESNRDIIVTNIARLILSKGGGQG